MTQVLPLGRPSKDFKLDTTAISSVCFNKDGNQMAVAADDEIRIYQKGKVWTLMHTLTDHTMKISGLDWHPETNKLLSVSHDRNAFVWTYDEGSATWEPTLVIVRCMKGLMCGKWSPDSKLMAIGSADKTLSVCNYEEAQNFWVSTKLRGKSGCRSTVICLAFLPDSQHIVIGSTDYKIRLALYKKKAVYPKAADPLTGDAKNKDGLHVLMEHEMDSWPQAVACAPSSNVIVACDSSSNFHVCALEGGEATWMKFPVLNLPSRSVAFLNDEVFVAGGYDRKPVQYSISGADLSAKEVDAAKSAAPDKKLSAMKKFQTMNTMGQAVAEFKCKTKHQNVITSVWAMSDSSFATADLRGAVWTWNKK